MASAYWVHDYNAGARSVNAQFIGADAAAGSYRSAGEKIGSDAFEVGIGAGVSVTERTTVRANGSWQIRDGSNQPSLNLGVTVQF